MSSKSSYRNIKQHFIKSFNVEKGHQLQRCVEQTQYGPPDRLIGSLLRKNEQPLHQLG